MQCTKKDSQAIIRELTGHFKKQRGECDMSVINDIIESLGKRLDSQLIAMIVEMLPSLGLKQDERTYEILLTMHASTRGFAEVRDLVSEMRANNIEFSTRSSIALVKVALQTGNFDEAKEHFSAVKASRDAQGQWAVPRHVVAQVVELACKEHQLEQFLPELNDVPLPE